MKLKNIFQSAKLTGLSALLALSTTFSAYSESYSAQQSTNITENTSTYSPLKLQEKESSRKGDFYFLLGQGGASPGGDTKYYFRLGIREQIKENFWAGVEYINEGHPDLQEAGHRDGFAIPLWYFIPIGKEEKFRLEFGAGPYFNMNTTPSEDNSKEEYNKKNLGLLLSLGASYKLSNRIKAMIQANEVLMSGFNSFAITAGLGLDLEEKCHLGKSSEEKNKLYSLSLLGGPSVTTRGDAEASTGYKVNLRREIPEISKRVALSLGGISEGNSGLSCRRGIMSQAWFIAPKISWLELSAGAGPYLAQENNPEIKCNEILGIVSIDARIMLTENIYGEFMFDRVVSTKHVDQDNFFLGGGVKF